MIVDLELAQVVAWRGDIFGYGFELSLPRHLETVSRCDGMVLCMKIFPPSLSVCRLSVSISICQKRKLALT
jgi:hypothetical protein